MSVSYHNQMILILDAWHFKASDLGFNMMVYDYEQSTSML